MNYREATASEVQSAEAEIDAYFRSQLPSHAAAPALAFAALQVVEDSQRLPLLNLKNQAPLRGAERINIACDNAKFTLKELFSAQPQALPIADGDLTATEDGYAAANTLRKLCENHQPIRTAFTSYHKGLATCRIEPNLKHYRFDPAHNNDAHDVLNLIENQARPEQVPLVPVQLWFTRPDMAPEFLPKLLTGVSINRNRIKYGFDLDLARKLDELLGSKNRLLPDEWNTTDWGNGADVRAILGSLQTLAIYHLMTILLATKLKNVSSLGVSSCLLEIPLPRLVEQIASLSGRGDDLVHKHMAALVLGVGTLTHDPALQPLTPTRNACVTVSPMLIASSNIERNFLALLSRIDRTAFDSASHVFSEKMCAYFETLIAQTHWKCKTCVTLPGHSSTGDIDLLVADEACRTILVGELKWTIPAGDVPETVRRHEDSRKKVDQLKRKLAVVQGNVALALQALGINAGGSWRVQGVVVLDGSSGGPRGADEIPVMNVGTFRRGLLRTRGSLRRFCNWLSGNDWLPRRTREFERHWLKVSFGPCLVEWPTARLTDYGWRRVMESELDWRSVSTPS